MEDAQRLREAANEAERWVRDIMRGSTRDTRYTQAVMLRAAEHILRMAYLLHHAAPKESPPPLPKEPA